MPCQSRGGEDERSGMEQGESKRARREGGGREGDKREGDGRNVSKLLGAPQMGGTDAI